MTLKSIFSGKSLVLGAGLALAALPVAAKDMLLTPAKDGKIHIFDAAAREHVKSCDLGVESTPGVMVLSPDNSIAYVLVNLWEDVVGVRLSDCETVFKARGSTRQITRKTIASLAVSKDGTQLYTVRNPVKKHSDRFETLPPELAVFDTSAGLKAKPTALHKAPRRSTLLATDKDGTVYIAGHDIYAVDPETGETTVKIANRSWDRPKYSPPDVLAFWPIGTQNNEFMLMYTAAVFADDAMTELADFVWGYSSVDLETGETDLRDFASVEVLMFSSVRSPHKPNELFGVYTQLSKHDVDSGELIKRVDLPHTYYVINVSTDGKEVYVGGTNDDIGVYDTETLERIGEMRIPSGADMSVATLQIANME